VLKKRLIGVVTVRQGWAVQSFGYNRYLPLGKPEILVENLDRWGADEILISCIDRSNTGLGPDFKLLERITARGLSTPVIYAGGVRNEADAVQVINMGAERIIVDAMLWDSPEDLELLSRELGNQALIAHFSVGIRDGALYWRNYQSGEECRLDHAVLSRIRLEWISEVMLTDWSHEGTPCAFDEAIPKLFPLEDKPLVLFGGFSEAAQIQRVLALNNVVAAGVGNFLNYKEHAIQRIKRHLLGVPLRAAHYASEGR
jgi:cyclase